MLLYYFSQSEKNESLTKELNTGEVSKKSHDWKNKNGTLFLSIGYLFSLFVVPGLDFHTINLLKLSSSLIIR